MRISTDPNDPGYRLFSEMLAQGITPLVELNGERIKLAEMADDVEGVVLAYVKDARGGLVLDPQKPGDALRVLLKGKVRIIRRHRHWTRQQWT